MNEQPSHCPSCGFPVRAGVLVCPGCKSLLPIEKMRALASASFTGTWSFDRILLTPNTLLWTLALVPLLIGPPVIALALVIVAYLSRPEKDGREFPTLLVLVALCNIVVSVGAWQTAGTHLKAFFNEPTTREQNAHPDRSI